MQRSERALDAVPGEDDPVVVRELRPDDLPWVERIDREHSGRARGEYYRLKLREVQADTGVRISLAALVDGVPAGFVMARVYYGEFGVVEPTALLDSIGVAGEFGTRGVAATLVRTLAAHMQALRVDRIETQVSLDQTSLLAFFRHAGFEPSAKVCLELPVQEP